MKPKLIIENYTGLTMIVKTTELKMVAAIIEQKQERYK